jgi:hypothetical protein
VAGCAGAQVGIWAAAVGEISGQASLHAVGTASVQWLAPPDPLRCAPWLTARSCRESRSARLNKKSRLVASTLATRMWPAFCVTLRGAVKPA